MFQYLAFGDGDVAPRTREVLRRAVLAGAGTGNARVVTARIA